MILSCIFHDVLKKTILQADKERCCVSLQQRRKTTHLNRAEAICLQILLCGVEECFYGRSFSGVSQSLKTTTKYKK